MKEVENIDYVELYGETVGEAMEQIDSPEFNEATREDKKTFFRDFLESISPISQYDRALGEWQTQRLNKFFETEHYKTLENAVLGSGMQGKDIVNKAVAGPLQELCAFVTSANVNATSKDGLRKTADTIKSINTYCKNTGIATEAENIPPDVQYERALSSFNKKRASFFNPETAEHKTLREAAEKIQGFRKNLNGVNPGKALLGKKSREEQVEIAKEWLRNAHELRDAARDYVNAKGVATMSPAGRERLKGAKSLKAIGKAEIDSCRKAIIAAGGESLLQEVYASISKDMMKDAKTTLSSMKDVAAPNAEQTKKMYDAIHTLVAGQASDNARTKKIPAEESNIFRLIRHDKANETVNAAVGELLYRSSPKQIHQVVSRTGAAGIMNEIKKYSHQAVQSKDLIQGAAKPQKTEKQIAAKNAAKAKGF